MGVREHGNAVVKACRDAGLVTGDGVQPKDAGWTGVPGESDFIPYIIVYPTGGGNVDGPLGQDRSELQLVYQLTCVGATREQTDFMRDKAREVMFSMTGPAGRRTIRMFLDVPIATSRDDDVRPSVFFSADRFRWWTTPLKESA